MRAEYFPSEVEEIDDAPASPQQADQWQQVRQRVKQQWPRIQLALLFVGGMAAAFMAVLLYQALNPPAQPLTTKDVKEVVSQAIASTTPMPAYSEFVYQVIQPSLVLIQVETTKEDGTPGSALGSGVVINDQGDILTSLHVVTESTVITLTFADGTKSPGQIASAEPENDIAVLTALEPPAEIYPAVLGNPGAQRVGDEAYVVGNPFGLYSSMSAGVISGFGRSFKPEESEYTLEDLIQIDAAVNPGNSGGPLLNRYGEVIGIVTGLVNPTEQNFFVGVGFAVPITSAAPGAGSPPY